ERICCPETFCYFAAAAKGILIVSAVAERLSCPNLLGLDGRRRRQPDQLLHRALLGRPTTKKVILALKPYPAYNHVIPGYQKWVTAETLIKTQHDPFLLFSPNAIMV